MSPLIRSLSEKRVAPLRFGSLLRGWTSIRPLVMNVFVIPLLRVPLRVRFFLIILREEEERPVRSLLYRGWANPTQQIRPGSWFIKMLFLPCSLLT